MPEKSPKTKQRSGKSKYFDSRKSAFRSFKRDYKIPVSQNPEETVKPDTPEGDQHKLGRRNRRLYIFSVLKNIFGITRRAKTHLREDKGVFYSDGNGSQGPHFNGGYEEEKLRDHYYFKKKK